MCIRDSSPALGSASDIECHDFTVGSVTKNFPDPKISSLKVGSRVALNDPQKQGYNWHGVIVELSSITAKVHWEERKGMKGGQIVTQQLGDLRPI